MRGIDAVQSEMFSYLTPEQRVPADHPLRAIRKNVNEALRKLSRKLDAMYSDIGRPSIAPEKLLRALLLQVFYTVRSERLLMEELNYNLLYRWFVGLNMDDPVWDVTVFTKNRDRLLEADLAREFFAQVVGQAREAGLLSDEHFSVDGTLIEAWASQKSFQRKDGGDSGLGSGRNAEHDFQGQKRSNDTHQSQTDPDARLYKKSQGKDPKLCYAGHVLMENRNGLVVAGQVTLANGMAEREAAVAMLKDLAGDRRATVAADKAYDTADFVANLREMNMTPHVAQNNKARRSAIDKRTTRHPGYEVSLRCRKRIEEIFGWLKTVGGMRKTRHRGKQLVGWMFEFSLAAYNLVRIPKFITDPG
jgi:transposase